MAGINPPCGKTCASGEVTVPAKPGVVSTEALPSERRAGEVAKPTEVEAGKILGVVCSIKGAAGGVGLTRSQPNVIGRLARAQRRSVIPCFWA